MTRTPQHPDKDDDWITGLLDDVSRTPVPDTPDPLVMRVMEDAIAMMPAPGGRVVPAPWWRSIVDGIGGWTAVGGLVAAAATGFVVGLGGLDTVGVSAPWLLDDAAYFDSLGTVDTFGWDMEEG